MTFIRLLKEGWFETDIGEVLISGYVEEDEILTVIFSWWWLVTIF